MTDTAGLFVLLAGNEPVQLRAGVFNDRKQVVVVFKEEIRLVRGIPIVPLFVILGIKTVFTRNDFGKLFIQIIRNRFFGSSLLNIIIA